MVCASAPQTIADAMKAAGLEADVEKQSDGKIAVKSEAGGYEYGVYLKDCNDAEKACAAVLFEAGFSADDAHTTELANQWNRDKRLAKMWIAADKALYVQYDIATVGGLNQTQFRDTVAWWNSMMDELGDFFDENLEP